MKCTFSPCGIPPQGSSRPSTSRRPSMILQWKIWLTVKRDTLRDFQIDFCFMLSIVLYYWLKKTILLLTVKREFLNVILLLTAIANSFFDWRTRSQLYLQNFYYWLQDAIKLDFWSNLQKSSQISYSIVSEKGDALHDPYNICKTRVTYVTLMSDPWLENRTR